MTNTIKTAVDELDTLDRKLTDITTQMVGKLEGEQERIKANNDIIEEIKAVQLEAREDAIEKLKKAQQAVLEAYHALEDVDGNNNLTWQDVPRLQKMGY